MVGKYEVKPTNVDQNATDLAKILKNDDLVIAAGGDATGVIAANAILNSGKDATLAVLPYGNFNDLSRTLGTNSLDDILGTNGQMPFSRAASGRPVATGGRRSSSPCQAPDSLEKWHFDHSYTKYYPLEILVDGAHFRYATCYVTIGMTAEAVQIYDSPKMRKKLKTNFGRKISSYTNLASWYFKNRHQKQFIPEFKLNDKLQPIKTSDYAAVNGRYMARVMKGGEDYKNPKIFRSETDRLTNFWRLFKLMFKSVLFRTPGTDTEGDILEFIQPATVKLQAEGESCTLKDVKKIEIRKSQKCLKVIQN
jgi:hypothetical protein